MTLETSGTRSLIQLISITSLIDISLTLYIPATAIACIYYTYLKWTFLSVFLILSMALIIVFLLILYFKLFFTCPGYVPYGWTPILDEHKVEWCKYCNGYKPPRSHHCKKCKRCVILMDHHCPWINGCVGYFNRRIFITYLALTHILSVYTLFAIFIPFLVTLYRACLANEQFQQVQTRDIPFGLMASACLSSGFTVSIFLFSGILIILQISNCKRNTAAVEKKIIYKVEATSHQRVKNPFNLGWRNNLRKTLFDSLNEHFDNWEINKNISEDLYFIAKLKLKSKEYERINHKKYKLLNSIYNANRCNVLLPFVRISTTSDAPVRYRLLPICLWISSKNKLIQSIKSNDHIIEEIRKQSDWIYAHYSISDQEHIYGWMWKRELKQITAFTF
ncbi:hypothetical protein GJ496_010652 [Pomphorhynchus laevis]|nr:hypothetical protein GJ496_010652 [Pomphorhynchus laevis]